MLFYSILAILQLNLVISKPIFNWWSAPAMQDITPEEAARHVDALYNGLEALRERKRDLKPTWTRTVKEKKEVSEKPFIGTQKNAESSCSECSTGDPGVIQGHVLLDAPKRARMGKDEKDGSHEPLISTQEDIGIASDPCVNLVQNMPSGFNTLVSLMDSPLGQWALTYYRNQIVNEEAKILSSLNEGYKSMSKGMLREAQTQLENAVYHDGLSKSHQKRYYSFNGPPIKFKKHHQYQDHRSLFDGIQDFFLRQVSREWLVWSYEEMVKARKDMERKWENGDNRLPNPTDIFMYHDTRAPFKKKAIEKATNALAHEIAGIQCLNQGKLMLAQIHCYTAQRLHHEAEETMEQVYETQFGSVDLKSCEAYGKMARRFENLLPTRKSKKIQGGGLKNKNTS